MNDALVQQDPWAKVEAALHRIKPDIDAASLAAIKARIDPDWHRAFFARAEHPHMSLWQIVELRNAIDPVGIVLEELRGISPQAWFTLRLVAQQQGNVLSTPERLADHLEVVLDHLKVISQAADALGRPPRGPKPGLMIERDVAGACASVYFDLRYEPPTTSHPDQRRTPEPYHDLVEAVFEGWNLGSWKERAVEAAKGWRDAVTK